MPQCYGLGSGLLACMACITAACLTDPVRAGSRGFFLKFCALLAHFSRAAAKRFEVDAVDAIRAGY